MIDAPSNQTVITNEISTPYLLSSLEWSVVLIIWCSLGMVSYIRLSYGNTHHYVSGTAFLNYYSSVMPNYIIYICDHLTYTRCCLNPVIYGLFGLIFRKTARKIFQRRATLNWTSGRWRTSFWQLCQSKYCSLNEFYLRFVWPLL